MIALGDPHGRQDSSAKKRLRNDKLIPRDFQRSTASPWHGGEGVIQTSTNVSCSTLMYTTLKRFCALAHRNKLPTGKSASAALFLCLSLSVSAQTYNYS